MKKNTTTKVVSTILIVILMSFLIVSSSLLTAPSKIGIVVDRITLDDGTKQLIYNTNNLALLKVFTISALVLSILTFLTYVGISVKSIWFDSDNDPLLHKKVTKPLYIIGIILSSIILIFSIYIMTIFPADYDKYNNFGFAIGIANIIFIISLIGFSIYSFVNIEKEEMTLNTKINHLFVTEGAMMVALSVILSVIGDLIPWINLPFGGGISLSMLPILIFALRKGSLGGALVGIVYGIVNFLIDGSLWHWGSVFFDYLIPYTLVGLIAGLFTKKAEKGLIFYSLLAVLLGGFARYISHSLSGVLFFSEWVPEGMTAFYYSFIAYNGPYMAINIALCMVFIVIVHRQLITSSSRVV